MTKKLPKDVLRDLLCALPETVCVLNAPRHPSSTGSASVILPEHGPAAALQARLLGLAADATGNRLVPHCHPAVTHVQLASACCQVLVQLAEGIKSFATPYGPGCPFARAPLEDRQRAVLGLLNQAMTRASESLSYECPENVWDGVLLAEDHADELLSWVSGLDIVRAAPLREPVWRQGALECFADDVVQHSEEHEVLCFRHLMEAACGKMKPAHLPELLALRAAKNLPRLPLTWVLHQPSKYELWPSRVLLHVLWEQSDNLNVASASREVHLGRDFPQSAARHCSRLLRHVLNQHGVEKWLQWTPFSRQTAMRGTTLLDLESFGREFSAGWGKEAGEGADDERDPSTPYPNGLRARLMIFRSRDALLFVDFHWEALLPLLEEQASDPACVWSTTSVLCDGGCEIQ